MIPKDWLFEPFFTTKEKDLHRRVSRGRHRPPRRAGAAPPLPPEALPSGLLLSTVRELLEQPPRRTGPRRIDPASLELG